MNESSRSWVLPEEPVPVRLMGTIWADTDGLHDDLDTPLSLDAWMDAVGIHHGDTPASPEELAEARALRDSLRCLAPTRPDDTRPARSLGRNVAWVVDVLNAAAARLPAAQLRIEKNAFRRATPNPAVRAALAGVATEAVDLFGGTDADKPAPATPPAGPLLRQDSPRREWCSIACGNRARAARHYHRRRQSRRTRERTDPRRSLPRRNRSFLVSRATSTIRRSPSRDPISPKARQRSRFSSRVGSSSATSSSKRPSSTAGAGRTNLPASTDLRWTVRERQGGRWSDGSRPFG